MHALDCYKEVKVIHNIVYRTLHAPPLPVVHLCVCSQVLDQPDTQSVLLCWVFSLNPPCSPFCLAGLSYANRKACPSPPFFVAFPAGEATKVWQPFCCGPREATTFEVVQSQGDGFESSQNDQVPQLGALLTNFLDFGFPY